MQKKHGAERYNLGEIFTNTRVRAIRNSLGSMCVRQQLRVENGELRIIAYAEEFTEFQNFQN
jgi:hypothetical protein